MGMLLPIIIGFSMLFMGLFIKWIMPQLNRIEEHFNKPLVNLLAKREFDSIYQHSYCRKGHPEHPCDVWLCPYCSICQRQKDEENRNQFHGGQYSETRRK